MKILAFAGSTRKDSLNRKLLTIAIEQLKGLEINLLDLKDFPLPLYDGDLETEQFPDNALKLKQLFLNHQGFLIACPEYNSSISGILKNTIDWVSRPRKDESEYLICFKDKVCALMSASPGNLGGSRGLIHIRSILQNIGSFVMPGQVCIPTADKKFKPDGSLNDDKHIEEIKTFMSKFAETLTKLST